jgi:DNA-binding PadR family transcriptional regulator
MRLDELGRFSEPALLVLVSLADGPKHGYAITVDVEQTSGRRLGPGTLYGVLDRLTAAGLAEPLPAEGRRKPYKITSSGLEVLTEHLKSLRAVVQTGLRRLALA